ncbi:MAG: hypothetical protein ABI811_10635 [Acidobacteriota bacterium]
MTTPTTSNPKIRELAHRLLVRESTAGSQENEQAILRVSEKFRRLLITLIGLMGYRTLLARTLTLARVQAPTLSAITVSADGSLEGFVSEHSSGNGPRNQARQDPSDDAAVTLIAQLLGLLAVFIGEGLTLHLVLTAWPDLPVSDTEPWRRNDQ